jgi:hypothetical protein
MADKQTKFEKETVKVLRGLEAKKIAEYEDAGWELVSQEKGKIRTSLNFQRPKKPISTKQILAGAALVLVGAIGITFASLSEEGESSKQGSETQVTQEAEETPTAEPTPEAEEVLTVENNVDLARLLADKSGDTDFWKFFFEKYYGRTFEFDGNIAFMTGTPGYKYTVDCLIEAGNYSETSSVGPPFRAPMINIHSGFKVKDSGDRSTLFQGDNIRIVARLVDFNPVGETFEIDIVSTKIR